MASLCFLALNTVTIVFNQAQHESGLSLRFWVFRVPPLRYLFEIKTHTDFLLKVFMLINDYQIFSSCNKTFNVLIVILQIQI